MVPTAPVAARATGIRPGQLWVALIVAVGVLTTVIVAGSTVTIPYFSIAPGDARDTAALISLPEGVRREAGEILFLTITLDHVTLVEGVAGWADGDVDLVPEERILGDQTEADIRKQNVALMTGSKNVAAAVAFTKLGYELTPTATGAVVADITPGTPAESVLEVTDTLVSVDGQPVHFPSDLATLITARAPGTEVTLGIEAIDGSFREERVAIARCGDIPACIEGRTVEEAAATVDNGFLGVATEPREFDPGLPCAVGIDSGGVGGPSAGLAFTLALLDVLTEGDLTGGRRIAVTGTIEPDGRVGPIGGIVQKTAAAADRGAEVMLVPASEVALALENPRGLEVIGVDNLDDALAALERVGGTPLPIGARPC